MFTIIGGTPVFSQLDISFGGELPVSADTCAINAQHSRALGLKTYRSWQTANPRVAVVGGGPSIKEHLDVLKNWDGDVWAINGAWKWCRDNGIEATFFACDPHPIVAQWAEGADKALIEISCDPAVFEALKSADVYTFDADAETGGIIGYASTASSAPHLAIRMGYRSVTFFGCESSYLPNKSHAFMDEDRAEQMIVRCNGNDYLTAPDLFLQAMGLSSYIKQVPEFISEQSGGLLGAMIEDPKFHIAWISQPLADALEGHGPRASNISPAYKPVSGAVAMADNVEAFGLTEPEVLKLSDMGYSPEADAA